MVILNEVGEQSLDLLDLDPVAVLLRYFLQQYFALLVAEHGFLHRIMPNPHNKRVTNRQRPLNNI